MHRTGALAIGDIAVWIGVCTAPAIASSLPHHDNLKHRLPIWKKELYTDGSTAWIESNHCGCADPKNLEHHCGHAH